MAMRIQKSKYQKRYNFLLNIVFLLFCDTNIGYVFFTPTVEYSLNTETCKFLHIKTEILTANFLPILFVLNHWEFATNQSLLVYKGSA